MRCASFPFFPSASGTDEYGEENRERTSPISSTTSARRYSTSLTSNGRIRMTTLSDGRT
jgi:hypothetical protein